MIFTFETLPLKNKELVQEQIQMLFARDIGTASCEYDMYNYRFIFNEGCFPAIIRIGEEMPYNTMEDMLCEMVWIDDLRNDIPTICQPIPSQGNRLVERITAGETVYLAAMFRKANGAIPTGKGWDAHFFYNAGALLGKIHRTSNKGYESGFRYKRKHWDEYPYYDVSNLEGHYPPHIQQEAQALIERINSIPRDPRWYGMIHGLFYHANLFSDWSNLWVFNFDSCCHGYFICDVACMANACVQNQSYAAKHPTVSAHDRMWGEDGVLTHLRAGYSTEYQLPDEQWEMMEDFLRLDTMMSLNFIALYDIFPEDIMRIYADAILVYLEKDQSPIDRVDEVQQSIVDRLTPEQKLIVATEMPWFD